MHVHSIFFCLVLPGAKKNHYWFEVEFYKVDLKVICMQLQSKVEKDFVKYIKID